MARQVPRTPWHPVPRRAFCTYLQYRLLMTCSRFISFAYLTCGLLIRLCLAYIFCYFIRNRRCSLVVYSGFTSGEYHVIRVDFIVALRRTKGRRRWTLRSPSPPSSGLHLLTPGESAAAGKYRLPRVWGNIGIRYPVLSLLPSSEYGFAFCVRAGIVRVSVGLLGGYRTFFIIGRIGRSCLRLRGGLAFSFVGFALTAIGAFLWAGNGMGNLYC